MLGSFDDVTDDVRFCVAQEILQVPDGGEDTRGGVFSGHDCFLHGSDSPETRSLHLIRAVFLGFSAWGGRRLLNSLFLARDVSTKMVLAPLCCPRPPVSVGAELLRAA